MTYSLAIVKSGFGPDEAPSAAAALLAAQRDDAKLYLFTDHELDCDRSVVVKSLEGDHGKAAAYLHNTGVAAATSGAPLDYVREGLDLLCLERALGIGRCDCFLLMRQAGMLSDADMIWLERNETDLMRKVPALDGTTNYLFDCRRPLTMKAISLALDLYRSGALLSLDDPSLGRALWLATRVLANGARARPPAGEEP
jgi:hypothetical protein